MLSLRIVIGLQKIENSLIGGEGDSNPLRECESFSVNLIFKYN